MSFRGQIAGLKLPIERTGAETLSGTSGELYLRKVMNDTFQEDKRISELERE